MLDIKTTEIVAVCSGCETCYSIAPHLVNTLFFRGKALMYCSNKECISRKEGNSVFEHSILLATVYLFTDSKE